ncbi:MAG: glycosyltransferase [Syntrophorhabdales bacterium]|jgi:GT2 family glycosyltransferase
MLKDILAILVLYNTRLDESETFRSLAKSVQQSGGTLDLLVYDNSAAPMFSGDKIYGGYTIHYMHDETNPGVSKAYNEGAKLARALDKKWLLLLDQDTTFPEDALDRYEEAMDENPDRVLFTPVLVSEGKICSPCTYRFGRGFYPKTVPTGPQSLQKKSVLGSGLCISLEAFESVGGFNENIRLDFADQEFVSRYKTHFTDVVVIRATCEHGLSVHASYDLKSSLKRFSYYCEGAKRSINGFTNGCTFLVNAVIHTARLSIRYRSVRFVQLFFRAFILGRNTRG